MAFCNKIGSLLRHGVSQSAQTPATLFNSIRCMSSSKLFVGGLSYGTDDQSLRDAFSGFGDVVEVARVIIDRNTGRSRGFGFVNFSSDDCASSALSAMDGQDLQGRHIRVSYATERSESSGRSFGGGGGGGYRGGDGGFGRGRGGDFDF